MSNDNIIQTVKNALRNSSSAMAMGVITNTRREHPALYNAALSQFNNEQRQAGRPESTHKPAVLAEEVSRAVASVAQTVNNSQQDEELESLDEEDEAGAAQPDAFDSLDEEIAEAEIVHDEDIDEDFDDEEPESDFEDEEPAFLGEEDEALFEGLDAEQEPEQVPTIEFVSFRHTLAISLFLNEFEGEQYEGADGVYYTSKQPLRRGKGVEGDASGSVRASLETFIEGLRAEGEGLRIPVGVTDNVVDRYVANLNDQIEERLSVSFSEESQASVSVTATTEVSSSPWGSDARVVVRNIGLSFPVPAIVNAGRKAKDEIKMLESNLKIVKNLVRQVKETANVESVQVNILIQDSVMEPMAQVFNSLLSEGNIPVFDRGYARFTVQTEDSLGGEVEG